MKRKRKKRRKEKKRREKGTARVLRPYGAPGESVTTRPRGTHTPLRGIFII